ncbi:PucR family transcriptional regulator [Deinococcus detaillensis]|uniref:PucR family transcriptional regulator n=1 Tax=Deinococcus detaillensis TaxID=2592048 RepID=A0A553V531_9DEIO|nr:helix-turn-helix domain-containing protein [Deinococcus detaillensis]TSA87588.1 PucR family transcriptional regulator [Deinococcus detaillensis]
MPSLNALRLALCIPAEGEAHFQTLEEAQSLLPNAPRSALRAAALRLLAQESFQSLPAAASLLTSLAATLQSHRPERELVQWLALVTGGQAELRSSWGDTVARAGTPSGDQHFEQRLTYEGRSIGSLHLWAGAEWPVLFGLTAEFAKLARLQAAAAGASRRRVGERVLEALLSGDVSGASVHEPCMLAALRLAQPLPRSERSRETHIAALDILCGVGEGYFRERGLKCLTTVRGDKAIWLWDSQGAAGEAAGLLSALRAATETDFRLGVSAVQASQARASTALEQAEQALSSVRAARGLIVFERLDPLQALLDGAEAQALAGQLLAQLRGSDPGGKLEETLRRYLSFAGSLGTLATELNIHINTLRYRLSRIEEVLGGKLGEPAFVARVFLALSAAEKGH